MNKTSKPFGRRHFNCQEDYELPSNKRRSVPTQDLDDYVIDYNWYQRKYSATTKNTYYDSVPKHILTILEHAIRNIDTKKLLRHETTTNPYEVEFAYPQNEKTIKLNIWNPDGKGKCINVKYIHEMKPGRYGSRTSEVHYVRGKYM